MSAQASERTCRTECSGDWSSTHATATSPRSTDRQIRDVLATTRRLGVQPSDVQTRLSIDKEHSDRYSSIRGESSWRTSSAERSSFASARRSDSTPYGVIKTGT